MSAAEDAETETSEWELQERREREEEREAAEELGSAGELGDGVDRPRFLPRPPSWRPQEMRSRGRDSFSFV